MSQYNLSAFGFLLLFFLISCQPKEQEKKAKRPNVVFILADDLGVKDLSCTGSSFYETPNIDRIARQGFRFSQAYAASRVCSPSRASIMTGQFTARHGITDWIGAKTGEDWRELQRHDKLLPATYTPSLPKEDTTLAEAFKLGGYKTFFAGKWHLGEQGSYPEDHGFDINVGGWEKGSPIGGFFSPWENPNLPNKESGENLSMRLAKETADFIRQHRDTSFFAFLSFYAVHAPIQTTQNKWQKYRQKAIRRGLQENGYKMEEVLPIRQVQDNPVYAGLVESMDDAIGWVLKALEENGLAENTIIVFTSDNGGVASGDAFATSNLPLRGGKGYQWEGGIREPYFLKVPWLKAPAKEIDYPVIGTDFYPTLLQLAELPLLPKQHLDGLDLVPLLEGKALTPRSLYWHYPHYGNQGGQPSSIIRKEQWKLIYYWENGRMELYDLQQDSSETTNIAQQHPAITKKLGNELLLWLDSVQAKQPTPDPLYDPVLAEKRKTEIRTKLWLELEQDRLKFLDKDFQGPNEWWGSKKTVD